MREAYFQLSLLSDQTDAPPWRDATFDAAVNEQEAGLVIMGQALDAADALASDRDAYLTALEEWRDKVREQLDKLVLETFPAPVAQYFWRATRGNPGHLERISAVRDTFEALVHILHAIVLAELRASGARVPSARVQRGWVDSQTLKERLELVRQVVLWGNPDLTVTGQTTSELLAELELLIGYRNQLAHRAQPSHAQAEEWLKQMLPALQRALFAARWLRDVALVQPDRGAFRLYRGHSTELQYLPTKASKQLRTVVASRENPDREIFLLVNDQLLPVHPMLIPQDSAETHQSHLAFLKQRKGRRLIYERFGYSNELELSAQEDLTALDDMKRCFVND